MKINRIPSEYKKLVLLGIERARMLAETELQKHKTEMLLIKKDAQEKWLAAYNQYANLSAKQALAHCILSGPECNWVLDKYGNEHHAIWSGGILIIGCDNPLVQPFAESNTPYMAVGALPEYYMNYGKDHDKN